MDFLGSWRKGFTVLSAEGKNLQFWVLKKGRDSQCWVLKEGRILVVLGAEGRKGFAVLGAERLAVELGQNEAEVDPFDDA
jgi:hypothetical protein